MTVRSRDLPYELAGTYETKSAWNSVNNRFMENGPDHTRWTGETEFRFSDWKRLLMSIVMRFAFTRQTMKALHDSRPSPRAKGAKSSGRQQLPAD